MGILKTSTLEIEDPVVENPGIRFLPKPGYVAMVITSEGSDFEFQLSPGYTESLASHIYGIAQEAKILNAQKRSSAVNAGYKQMPHSRLGRPLQFLRTLFSRFRF